MLTVLSYYSKVQVENLVNCLHDINKHIQLILETQIN